MISIAIRRLPLIFSLLASLAACGDNLSNERGSDRPEAVRVELDDSPIAAGLSRQLQAIATYRDGTVVDVTASVTWTSGDSSVLTIDTTGLVTTHAPGTTDVTGSIEGVASSAEVTVAAAELASIGVTPTSALLAAGTEQPLVATGVLTDGSTIDVTAAAAWSSSDESVAVITEEGTVAGVAPGVSTIGAELDGLSSTTVLTVSDASLVAMTVEAPLPSMAVGTSSQLSVFGTFTDGSVQDLSQQAEWASSEASVVTIDDDGLATAVSQGASTISAELASVSAELELTVSAATLTAIGVTPANATLAAGSSQSFAATGTFSDSSTQDLTDQVVWSSSDSAVAVVSNAAGSEGVVVSVSAGQASIRANFASIEASVALTVSAATLTSIAITPAAPSIASGTQQQLEATGLYSDSSTQDLTDSVIWSSDDADVVTVSNAGGEEGIASAAGPGTATVTATHDGVDGEIEFAVTAAELESIAITPLAPSIAVGVTIQLSATGTFTDGSTQDLTSSLGWADSDGGAIAVASNIAGLEGTVRGVAVGATTISAADASSGVSVEVEVNVTAATLSSITVSPASPAIAAGSELAFQATGNFSDASTVDLTAQATWETDDASVATISNAAATRGNLSAVDVGSTEVTATFSGVVGSSTLTVTGAELVSLEVTAASPSIALGSTLQLTATGLFTDGSTQDLTSSVTWTCPGGVLSIDGTGSALAVAVGICPITARVAGTEIVASLELTVTAATLVSLVVTPAVPTLALGAVLQLTATGTFSDSSTQDLTEEVTWSCGLAALISNVAGTRGLALAALLGGCDATATHIASGIAGSAALSVTGAALVSITVTPDQASIATGLSQAIVAMGTFSNGSTADLTAQVTWSSSDEAVATVSNASGSEGQSQSVGEGTAVLTALDSASGISGDAQVAVTAAALVSLEITPADSSVAIGDTLELSATGTFSDGSTRDMTDEVLWQSSLGLVAAISNAPGSHGVATGILIGVVAIRALDIESGIDAFTALGVTLF